MRKTIFEAEVFSGLESFAASELRKIGGKIDSIEQGAIRFRFGKSLTRFDNLRVVNQVFEIHHFDIPRPKALLGQQHLDRLANLLKGRIDTLGKLAVENFRLEAAGKDSSVFQRIIETLEKRLNIKHDPDEGELFLRVKPSRQKKRGWEVLIRMSRRPLTVRTWREFNYPGALTGPVAAVLVRLAQIKREDAVLNMMCGSGSLLAEIQVDPVIKVGCDLNGEALIGAQKNLHAAGAESALQLADATRLPYRDSAFDVTLTDLPWAQLVGESGNMEELYTHALKEAWRVTKPNGKLVIITQLKNKLKSVLTDSDWDLVEQIDLKYNKVSPSIFVLKKEPNSY